MILNPRCESAWRLEFGSSGGVLPGPELRGLQVPDYARPKDPWELPLDLLRHGPKDPDEARGGLWYNRRLDSMLSALVRRFLRPRRLIPALASALAFSLISTPPARAQTAPTVTASDVGGASSVHLDLDRDAGRDRLPRAPDQQHHHARDEHLRRPAEHDPPCSRKQVFRPTSSMGSWSRRSRPSRPSSPSIRRRPRCSPRRPSPRAPCCSATNNNSVSLSWLTDGNPTGAGQVTYVRHRPRPPRPASASCSRRILAVSASTDSATATIGSLPGGMTINFDVQAVNSSGVASGFDVVVTTTIPVLVNQPSISSATFAAGVSPITWYWTCPAPARSPTNSSARRTAPSSRSFPRPPCPTR